MKTFTSKLGTAKGAPRSRVWIEGNRLIAAGFTPGEYYVIGHGCEGEENKFIRLSLLIDDDVIAPGVTPRKVSGKGAKPIIDLTGKWIFELFGRSETHVSVYFDERDKCIVINGASFDA